MTMRPAPTPGQTVGPFFGYAMPYPGDNELVMPHTPGAVLLRGRVTDGAGQPVPDAQIEIWQADAAGNIPQKVGSFHRDTVSFTGWGRVHSTADGGFQFWTVNPGSVDGGAPFIAVVVFARGLTDKLHTSIYLPDDAEALASDPLLARLEPEARATLIAERTPEGWLHHDIRLQGDAETVFLAYP